MPAVHPATPDAATTFFEAAPARRGESTLQVVLSLLRLRLHHAGTPEAAGALGRAIDEIDTVVVAHHQLNAAGAELLLDPGAALQAVAQRLAATALGIDVQARLSPARIATRHLTPLLLIAHEALVNALGHGFPEGRTGAVVLGLDELPDGAARLTIADNGVGLAADADFPAKGARGALLLRRLARQSGIGLTVTGSLGVTVTVDLPPAADSRQDSSM